jgi:hypothetical protein
MWSFTGVAKVTTAPDTEAVRYEVPWITRVSPPVALKEEGAVVFKVSCVGELTEEASPVTCKSVGSIAARAETVSHVPL